MIAISTSNVKGQIWKKKDEKEKNAFHTNDNKHIHFYKLLLPEKILLNYKHMLYFKDVNIYLKSKYAN